MEQGTASDRSNLGVAVRWTLTQIRRRAERTLILQDDGTRCQTAELEEPLMSDEVVPVQAEAVADSIRPGHFS
jgi:hypothetical protein